jgi:thioredoxin-like negative regulator of GroEL
MRWWGKRGERSVAAGGDIAVAVTGDHNHVLLTPPVRSAYWEQVRRIAPPRLVDREEESAELSAFCTADSGPAYAWWRAGAWAGKTALLSWYALHPPQGVRIVPFFITARLGAQNDVAAYVDVVLEQLAELSGEALPAHLTVATREAHLLYLYGAAARACAERGERLVLLVDGLDEDRGVTTGPDAHSIASLLPTRPEAGMRVLVAGRLNPPLPGDVPEDHPLRDPAIVRTLAPSPYARAIRAEAERELKRLIEGGGLEHDLLGLVAVAGGGLTAEDLAALTGAVPYRVRDVLSTRAGRTFGLRVNVYLLGHEELQSQAEEMLGTSEMDLYRAKLHAWAEEWRGRGWPEETPEYLLRGYFRMLRSTGDLERMLRCGADTRRQERMLVLTGSDASAVTEIHLTEDLIMERGARRPLDSLRLAIHRERLVDRSAGAPDSLPHAWALAGQTGRAVALARSLPDGHRRVMGLAAVADVLLERGDRDGALELLAEAEPAARLGEGQDRDDMARCTVADLLARAGQFDSAAALARTVSTQYRAVHTYVQVGKACLAAQRWDLAQDLVDGAPNEGCRTGMENTVIAAHAAAGRHAEAEAMARATEPGARAGALATLASALRESGQRQRADALCAEAVAWARDHVAPDEVVNLLAGADEFDQAEAFLAGLHGEADHWEATEELAGWLAWAGQLDRAEALLDPVGPGRQHHVLREVAQARAKAGRYEQAEELARQIPAADVARATLCSIVRIMADGGEADRAEALARTLGPRPEGPSALYEVVESLAQSGDPDRARTLADSLAHPVEHTHASVEVAAALARAGRREEAARLLLDVESRTRVLHPLTAARKLGLAATALAEAGYPEAALAVLDGTEALVADHRSEPDASPGEYSSSLRALVAARTATGEPDRAERLAGRALDDVERRYLLVPVVRAWARSGEVARAEAVMRAEAEADSILGGILAPLEVPFARGLAEAGHVARAEAYVRENPQPRGRTSALCELAVTLTEAGHTDRARRIVDEVITLQGEYDRPSTMELSALVRALAAAGETEAAQAALDAMPPPGPPSGSAWYIGPIAVAEALTALGHHKRALETLRTIEDPYDRARGMLALVDVLAESGECAHAEALAGVSVPAAVSRAWARIAAATTDGEQARRLTALALQGGEWVSALPALLKQTPDVVPLVVEAADAMKSACGQHAGAPTAARTSAPS